MCIPGARRISCACLLLSIVDRVCCQTGWSAKGLGATLFSRTGQPGSNTKSNRLVSLRLTCEPCHAAGNSGGNTVDRAGEGIPGVADDLRQGNLRWFVHHCRRWSSIHRSLADRIRLCGIWNCQTKVRLGSHSNIQLP